MMKIWGIAMFRTKTGSNLYGRISSAGDRIATIKAIGLGTIHRCRTERVAVVIEPPTIEKMIEHNLKAEQLADRFKRSKSELRATVRNRLDKFDRDGTLTRYDQAERASA